MIKYIRNRKDFDGNLAPLQHFVTKFCGIEHTVDIKKDDFHPSRPPLLTFVWGLDYSRCAPINPLTFTPKKENIFFTKGTKQKRRVATPWGDYSSLLVHVFLQRALLMLVIRAAESDSALQAHKSRHLGRTP